MAVAAVRRSKAVTRHVPPQHVGAVAGGSRPHANDAVFCRATERNVFSGRAGAERDALAETGVVEALPRGEVVRVAIGCAGKRAAHRQGPEPMLGTEGVEIERVRLRCGGGFHQHA